MGGKSYAPLQQANTVPSSSSVTGISNLMALIGAFIPRSLVNTAGFTPTDATKSQRGIGIMPDKLFFVGQYNSFHVSGPGVFFLGINDWYTENNSGSFSVKITFTPFK